MVRLMSDICFDNPQLIRNTIHLKGEDRYVNREALYENPIPNSVT